MSWISKSLCLKTLMLFSILVLTACSSKPLLESVPQDSDYTYQIGAGDILTISVWGNPEMSVTATVRPDGKISSHFVEDMLARGKTPTELAHDIEKVLLTYMKSPEVVVIAQGFRGVNTQQIRVIGRIGNSISGTTTNNNMIGTNSFGVSAGGSSISTNNSTINNGGIGRYQGRSIPYERGMTLLDIAIQIGLSQYADGNRSTVIRNVNGQLQSFRVRLDDLIDDADLSANVLMMPGDILFIPDAYF